MDNYIHGAVMQGSDSVPYIFKKQRGDDLIHFHKEYSEKDNKGNTVQKDYLVIYHMLHRLLKDEKIIIDCESFILGEKEYKGIKVSILDLDPEGVCEATTVSSRKNIWVTQPEYIYGKSIHEVGDLVKIENRKRYTETWPVVLKEIRIHVEKVIRRVTSEILQNAEGISFGPIDPVNVKVINQAENDGYLPVLITDLGASITSSIKSTRNNLVVEDVKEKLQIALQNKQQI